LIGNGTHAYTFNARGRLAKVTYGTRSNTYVLNGLGQRVSKAGYGVNTGTNRFIYDVQGHLLGDYAAQGCASAVGAGCAGAATSTGVAIQETVYLGDIPVAVLTPTVTYNLHADHLNTPRAITDTTNKVIWRWDSDPFGTTAANEDPDGNKKKFSYNLRFPGQYFDKETGLHYNYFRDYDPKIGRYVQSDPIGLAGGLNPYIYVGNNPLRWVDPLGLAKTSIDAAIEQAIIRGDVNQLRFLLENISNLSRAQSEALVQRCVQNLPDKIRKIASETGRSPKDIAKAIEQVKQQGLPKSSPIRNPDVRVDPRTGEVYPKTPDGRVGDSIGNIFDYLR
jgi:RHS repeat-associated protein